ncbi:MAG TPA: hypothetical protein VE957_10815 [Terriglobales bacterium]|nr:hypothetical protein [Terriglobales bacterium]
MFTIVHEKAGTTQLRASPDATQPSKLEPVGLDAGAGPRGGQVFESARPKARDASRRDVF